MQLIRIGNLVKKPSNIIQNENSCNINFYLLKYTWKYGKSFNLKVVYSEDTQIFQV